MNVKDKIREILSEREPGFRKILSYRVVGGDKNFNTYEVTFKEVLCGVSGIDTVTVNIPINDML